MCNILFSNLVKALIIWLYLSIYNYNTKELNSLNSSLINEVLYYHNIFRYVVTVGNIKYQPPASDMTLIRWNETLVKSLESISSECILMSKKNFCPSINAYKLKDDKIIIEKILKKWFNGNKYYNYFTNACMKTSCHSYKKILQSNTGSVGCTIKRIKKSIYFVCQYSQRTNERPYKLGDPCSSCIGNNNVCYKDAFCTHNHECKNRSCENLLVKADKYVMQADQMQFCNLPDVDCNINFYVHMCPMVCLSTATVSTTTVSSTTKFKVTIQPRSFTDNKVCSLTVVDCSIAFFKILCPKSCEGVLCRDPNIDCRNVFYVNCHKCQQLNKKMSDSKIISTTTVSSLEYDIILNDPKCQDLQYDNYCIDRGEMCFHFAYREWMKRLCCNTCRILEVCIDYLDFKSPGSCAEILSSGMCFTVWSQTFCRKTCKKC